MELSELLSQPRERRAVEYKEWLILEDPDHPAVLAKAAMAIANYGGGQIVIGFKSVGVQLELCDAEAPADVRQAYAEERVQKSIAKYCDPTFEVRVEFIQRPGSSFLHPVILVPAVKDPIAAAKSSPNERSLIKGSLLWRRVGPESSAPRTATEWAEFIDSFVERRLGTGSVPSTDASQLGPATRSVRDRMSSTPPPRSGANVPVSEETGLDPDERYVLEHPISEARVEELRNEIKARLSKLPAYGLTEILKRHTFEDLYVPEIRFGSSMLSFKGPFVEGSNWAEVREWEFASSLDRFLLNQFAELVAERAEGAPTIPATMAAIEQFVATAKREIQREGGQADILVVIPGDAEDELDRLLLSDPLTWTREQKVRGVDVHEIHWIQGAVAGLPILHVYNFDAPRCLLAVVDLSDYELRLARPTEDGEDFLHFSVTPIDGADAKRRLEEQPDLSSRLYRGKNHSEGTYSPAQSITRLQLMALYKFLAAGEFRERYVPRIKAAFVEFEVPPRKNERPLPE